MSFPKRDDFYAAMQRLYNCRETGTPPLSADLDLAMTGFRIGLNMQERIRGQRQELARLHEERQRDWLSSGDKTVWDCLPDGKPIIIVFRERNIAGYVLPNYQRDPLASKYFWKSGASAGHANGLSQALGEIATAYGKAQRRKQEPIENLLWNDALAKAHDGALSNLLIHQYQTAVKAAQAEPECSHSPQGGPDNFGYVPASNPATLLEKLAGDFITTYPKVNHAIAHTAISALYRLSQHLGESWSSGWASSYDSGISYS